MELFVPVMRLHINLEQWLNDPYRNKNSLNIFLQQTLAGIVTKNHQAVNEFEEHLHLKAQEETVLFTTAKCLSIH